MRSPFETARPIPDAGHITAADRNSLLVLLRQRERVAKTDVQEYGAVMLADFEHKLAALRSCPIEHPFPVHETTEAAMTSRGLSDDEKSPTKAKWEDSIREPT
jgi:hypothetical protein